MVFVKGVIGTNTYSIRSRDDNTLYLNFKDGNVLKLSAIDLGDDGEKNSASFFVRPHFDNTGSFTLD